MKITPDYLESLVTDETYTRPDRGTLTVCVLTLQGGTQLTGESNVIDAANFDAELGRRYAREDAVKKLWQLEGFHVKRQSSDLLMRAARAAHAAVAPGWEALDNASRHAFILAARDCIAMQPEDDIPSSVVDLTDSDQTAARYALVARAVFGK